MIFLFVTFQNNKTQALNTLIFIKYFIELAKYTPHTWIYIFFMGFEQKNFVELQLIPRRLIRQVWIFFNLHTWLLFCTIKWNSNQFYCNICILCPKLLVFTLNCFLFLLKIFHGHKETYLFYFFVCLNKICSKKKKRVQLPGL